MPEALARARTDFKLSRSTGQPARPRGGRVRRLLRGTGWFLLRQLSVRPATTVAGAAFAALMTGIVLNALVLQNTRHPAPLFGNPRQHAAEASPAPRTPVDPAPAAAPAAAPAPAPPARPASPTPEAATKDPITRYLKSGGETRAAEPHHKTGAAAPGDSIAQFLKGNHEPAQSDGPPPTDAAVLTAQRALKRLGYAVKTDGLLSGATRQAIERFERDRGMAAKGELTERVLRDLSAAARDAAH